MGGVELLVQFVAQEIELAQLELGDPNATLGVRGTQQRRVHELHDRALAKGMWNHLRAPALFAEEPLQEIRRPGRLAMRQG